MLHLIFGKNLNKGHRREFWRTYLYNAVPYQVIISYISVYLFWMLYPWKQNKNTSEFPQTNPGRFCQVHSSGSVRVQSAK